MFMIILDRTTNNKASQIIIMAIIIVTIILFARNKRNYGKGSGTWRGELPAHATCEHRDGVDCGGNGDD